MSYQTELRENFYQLGQYYPGYDGVLIQALLGLLAKEHMLWQSRPGRAKTAVARLIFGMFVGAPTYITQITKDMLSDDIFGDVIPDELIKHGKRIVNLDNGLADVVFAYLDEMMDGADYVLRSMLNVFNEREYHGSKDMAPVKSPLHSVIATTNFMRQREVTQAVLDRMICKASLPGVTELTDVMRAGKTYLLGEPVRLPHTLEYEGLKELSDQVVAPPEKGGVLISPGMRLLHVILAQEFQRQRTELALASWHQLNPDAAEEPTEDELGVPEITPRTLVRLHDMSRAAAVLNERNEVSPEDNRALGYGIYIVGDQSGDAELWHSLCDQMLRFNDRQRQSLEELGGIADQVGRIKAEKSEVTNLQLTIGGKLVELTDLARLKLVDRMRRNNHPVLDIAKRRLDQEVADLVGGKVHRTLDLVKGW